MDNQKTPKDIYYDLCDKYIETMDRGDIVEMAMIEYAEQQVKLFAIPDVSQRSELLAFAKEMQNIGFNEMDDAEKVVDIYIKANCG